MHQRRRLGGNEAGRANALRAFGDHLRANHPRLSEQAIRQAAQTFSREVRPRSDLWF
jgi:hypothetical protein